MQFNEPNPLAVSRLGIAARIGDEELLLLLLKNKSRIDLADNRGWNAIHEAAAADNVSSLRHLLKKGRRYVNQRTMEGETPLLLACLYESSTTTVRVLLRYGADVNLGNNEDHRPLHEVCKSGNLGIAEVLVAAGADVNSVDFNKWTPLHFAVTSGSTNVVKFLLRKGADVMLQEEYNRTPLFLACELSLVDIVKPLVERYASIDTRSNDGATALMLASQNGSLSVVQELLKRGADPDLAADDGVMALHLAVHSGVASVVKLLLQVTSKEAIINHCTKPSENAARNLFYIAIYCENWEMLKILATSHLGSDILAIPVHIKLNYSGIDNLLEKFKYKCASCVSILLDRSGESLKENTVTNLELLLKNDFPVNVTDSNCAPPLVVLAVKSQESEILKRCVDMLIAKGADIDYTSKCPGIPDALLAACARGHCSLVLKFLQAGSSCLPEDLLRHLLFKGVFSGGFVTDHRAKMVKLLLSLDVTDPELYGRLKEFLDDSAPLSLRKLISKPLAEYQMLPLQKLCRAAVRKQLRKPFVESLNQLNIPECLKDYILYKLN